MSTFTDTIDDTTDNGFNVRNEYKSKTVDELKDIALKDSLPYTVCAVNVEGDLNIGMMARTASLLGCKKFYIFGRRKIDRRSLVGAQNYLPISRVDGLDEQGNVDLDKFKAFLLSENLYPVLVEHGGSNLKDVNWKRLVGNWTYPNALQLCLVFGNESNGFPESFLAENWPRISVPQRGVLRSFNVASAASIVLWDLYSRYF